MSILITKCVKAHDFEGTKKAAAKYAQKLKKAGCLTLKIYRSDDDPNFLLWLMEWESRAAFEALGNEVEFDINSMVGPVGDWNEVIWDLSDAVTLE
jgi:quinol monooxygenase YgiN